MLIGCINILLKKKSSKHILKHQKISVIYFLLYYTDRNLDRILNITNACIIIWFEERTRSHVPNLYFKGHPNQNVGFTYLGIEFSFQIRKSYYVCNNVIVIFE